VLQLQLTYLKVVKYRVDLCSTHLPFSLQKSTVSALQAGSWTEGGWVRFRKACNCVWVRVELVFSVCARVKVNLLKSVSCRKIRLLENNAKCRRLKILTPLNTVLYTCIQYTYSHREGGEGGRAHQREG
jgi:hypothetical protein